MGIDGQLLAELPLDDGRHDEEANHRVEQEPNYHPPIPA
jgi:hypothetical protein